MIEADDDDVKTHTKQIKEQCLAVRGGGGRTGRTSPESTNHLFVVSYEKYAHIHANQVIVVKNKWIELG